MTSYLNLKKNLNFSNGDVTRHHMVLLTMFEIIPLINKCLITEVLKVI